MHCSLDGCVVKAGQKALAEGNVNLVLIWVKNEDETQTRRAFEKALAVRKLSAEAQELADLYFSETLVRIHHAGEGTPHTGLKPAERDPGPAIHAADKALEVGNIEPIVKLLLGEMGHGLSEHFVETVRKKGLDENDVEAGRAFVKAYVDYVRYIERLHEAAASSARDHFHEAEGVLAPQDKPAEKQQQTPRRKKIKTAQQRQVSAGIMVYQAGLNRALEREVTAAGRTAAAAKAGGRFRRSYPTKDGRGAAQAADSPVSVAKDKMADAEHRENDRPTQRADD